MPNETIIIGIGHPDRGDDALGPVAIDKLSSKVPSHIVLKKCLGDMAQLLEDFDAYNQVILIDAMVSQDPVGTLHQFKPHELSEHQEICRASTHAFSLGQTLALAQNLDIKTHHIYLYGIEAKQFEHGQPLSTEVAQQIDPLISHIMTFLDATGALHA